MPNYVKNKLTIIGDQLVLLVRRRMGDKVERYGGSD